MSPSRHPLADAIAASGAPDRNPSYGELFWQIGLANKECDEKAKEILVLKRQLYDKERSAAANWGVTHARELMEILEAAGVIVSDGPVAGYWRLTTFSPDGSAGVALSAPETRDLDPSGDLLELEPPVVDAEVVG